MRPPPTKVRSLLQIRNARLPGRAFSVGVMGVVAPIFSSVFCANPSCMPRRNWLLRPARVISSVVERFVHIEDVRSSNLLSPTISYTHLITCGPRGCSMGLALGPQTALYQAQTGGVSMSVHPKTWLPCHGRNGWNRSLCLEGQRAMAR